MEELFGIKTRVSHCSVIVVRKKEKDVARGEEVGEEGARHDGRGSKTSTEARRLPGKAARRSSTIHSGRWLSFPNLSRRRSIPSHTGSAGPVSFSLPFLLPNPFTFLNK